MPDISQIELNGTTYDIKDAVARTSIDNLDSEVDILRAQQAHPVVANSLTNADTTKIYIVPDANDNNKPHWYHYNGSTWVNDGVWGSVIPVDAELETEGAAADAKVVGDEVGALKENIAVLSTGTYQAEVLFEQGGFVSGEDVTTNYRYRIRTPDYYLVGDWERLTVNRSTKAWRTWIAYYDSEKVYLSSQDTTASNITLTPPEGAVYFRILAADLTNSSWSNRVYPENGWADYHLQRKAEVIGTMETDIKNLTANTQAVAYLATGAAFSWQRSGNKVTVDVAGTSILLRKSPSAPAATITFASFTDAATTAGWEATETGVIAPSHSCGIYYDLNANELVFRTGYTHPNKAEWLCLFENHYASFATGLLIEYGAVKRAYTPAEIPTDSLPDYYEDHIAEKIPVIRENIMDCGKNGETFVFITDLHWEGNKKNSPALIERIMKSTNIGAIICGGDLINQGTREKMAATMAACIGAFQFGKPFPVAMGNHDDNWNNWDSQREYPERRFSLNDVYGLIQKQAEDSITYITDNRFNFYYDRPATKTRFIVLDTWDTTANSGNGGYSFTEYAELAACLNETPPGYHVILVAHAYYASGSLTSYTANIETMVDAYNAREAVTINGNLYDFAAGEGEVVLLIGGHVHKDMDFATTDGTPLVLTDCDAGSRSLNEDYPYVAGTITEQAFDVVSINYAAKTIKCVRIGRGADRTFSY